ncbi:hypothetical protein [Aquimarina sp. I32.4]|uniref:hypothetical protein n=1 Tax=Aquimarina sp. I32.4 TaxID=2053903 RepID=UPI0018EBC68B|nr:hypothetical protein [Aquimarina sp. I32.4]
MILYKNIAIILWYVLLVISCFSCSRQNILNKETKPSFSLFKQHDSLYNLTVNQNITSDFWELSYPVYHFQTGDVDDDGIEDAMVGVVKTTRFDSKKAKRLFIFKNYKGLVRPLWLGSRLGQPLVNFRFKKVEKKPRIWSVEREKSRKYLVAEYKWRKFGLEFTRYLKREIDSMSAFTLLEK